jgi:competence protein ComEC
MRSFVLSFALGTLALQQSAELPGWHVAAWGLAALLAACICRTAMLRVVLVLGAGFAMGFGYAAWRADVRLADELARAWEGRDVVVVGRIASLPQVSDWGSRFLLDVEQSAAPRGSVPGSIALTWYADAKGEKPVARVVPGEQWAFTVRLKRPRGLANPHTFQLEPWALERDIRATGYVRAKPAPIRTSAAVDGWPYSVHRWRDAIRASMQDELGEARLRGVLVALAIGDQDAIAADDWEVFWRTGVGHLMSISGLHITMFAGLAFAVAHFAWVRVPALALRIPARKAAAIAGTMGALGYTLMTGYAIPAQRTFAMLAVVALCVLADRHGSASRVLALAALAVLMLDPWAALSAGFWLSFGAVAAIFYAMGCRTGQPGKLRAALTEQLSVTVVMVPMLLALFQEVSLVSPLANAIAIPVVSLIVVPLAVAGGFSGSAWLLWAAHELMVHLMGPLEMLAGLPLAMLESHAPGAWAVGAAVVGCAWLLAPRGVPMRSAGAVWLVPLFTVAPPAPAWGEAWVDVLDVGNGLAVVVRTATHALAYDAGPAGHGEGDTGNRIVVPFLRGEGVARLDGLVISHADDDHAGGAISLAAAREPPWLLSSLPAAHPLQGLFDHSIRCEAGRQWTWDGVTFRVLHPAAAAYEDTPGRKPRKENDRSCVLHVATAGGSALLAGDAEARSESEMIARGAAMLGATALVVPHHGSRTSSTPEFIAAVSPRVALFSVGYRNRFNHPNAGVVARYAALGADVRRTDREGALRIALPAQRSVATTVRPLVSQVRYWSERRTPWID